MTRGIFDVAAHEAGHALLVWFWRSLRLRSATASSGRGQVTYFTQKHPRAADCWEETVVAVAGIAGQFTLGFPTQGQQVENDLTRALERAERLVLLTLGTELREALAAPTDGRAEICRMFQNPPTGPVSHVL